MAGKRVPVLDPDGKFGTIDEAEVDQLPEGARVLTKQEQAQKAVDDRYDALPTEQKVLGAVNDVAPLLFGPAGLPFVGQSPGSLPEFAEFGHGTREGLTAGLADAGARKFADAVGGKASGDKYAAQVDEGVEASPIAHAGGSIYGMVAGSVLGESAGLARALPGAAIPSVGAGIEAGVESALGGLAKRGVLGRAATTAAGMATRGAVEGTLYGVAEQASSDVLHDSPITGAKMYAAGGHGALLGGALGGILGLGGSLAASGTRAAGRTIAKLFLGEVPALEAPSRGSPVPALTAEELDAGLHDRTSAADPFREGSERRPIQLRPGGRPRVDVGEGPIAFRKGVTIDPDAGLGDLGEVSDKAIHPTGRTRADRAVERIPIDDIEAREPWDPTGKMPNLRAKRAAGVELDPIRVVKGPLTEGAGGDGKWALDDGIHRTAVARERGEADILAHTTRESMPQKLNNDVFNLSKGVDVEGGAYREHIEPRIDTDAGIAERTTGGKFQGRIPTEDALRLSSAKSAPHRLLVSDVADELAPVESRAPFKFGSSAPKLAAGGAARANATVGEMAAEQAWKAVGGGFGLQTTRYAKEAAKYFPGGTKDLGKIALKYGVIDMDEAAATPWQAAATAARSGTPDAIAPKVMAALDGVGQKIGDITDQSGARVNVADLDAAIARVRAPLDKIAGNEHVVGAIDSYAESLRSKLAATPDGTVSVQDLLEQRKGLDQIVFQETKTLDPGRRVAALRAVRSEMEDLITEAMDNASGKVPGELRAEYKALKTDYHGLRILSEAAEDSAARSAKHATLGFSEKAALFMGLASGHVAAAPLLAIGGKVINERGNAAAAAFLTRAVDRGHVEAVVNAFDGRVRKAAAGVLREAPSEAGELPAARQRKTPNDTRAQTEQARADVHATQDQAEAIVKWVGSARANPAQLMDQLQQAASVLGQGAGSRAAESYTAQTLKAIAFVAGQIPVRERRDPLDPRSVPPMTFDDADRLVRAATYATKPETILDDFESIVTPEGLRAADSFIPSESMREFRVELQRHVEDHMARNGALTQSQRLRIDKLLQYPAGADLKPRAIARLQANLTKKAPSGPPPAGPTGDGGGNPPPAPVQMNVQQTGFDAIEARKAS